MPDGESVKSEADPCVFATYWLNHMGQLRREKYKVASADRIPPTLRIVSIPFDRRKLNSAISILVEEYLVVFLIGIYIKTARDKAVWVCMFVVELTRLGPVQPRLRNSKSYVVLWADRRHQVFMRAFLNKCCEICELLLFQNVFIDA